MKTSIAIVNPQGGSGKSITSLMLAYFYSQSEKKVLFIDTDPLAYSSYKLFPHNLSYDLHDALNGNIDIKETIVNSVLPHVTLIPASHDLISFEIENLNLQNRELILRKLISKVVDEFDVVIMDTPSSLGLLTVSAMSASDMVIIPILSNEYELMRITQMIRTIKVLQTQVNKKLTLKGILVNLIGKPLFDNKEILINLKNNFDDLIFNTIVFWDENYPMIDDMLNISASMDKKTYNSYCDFYEELIT